MPYEKNIYQLKNWCCPRWKPTDSSPWGITRIDLNSKTAVDLEVPDDLWLFQQQNSTIRNGKFYIALAPVEQTVYTYRYDANSTSPKGTNGASITSGTDQYFIGIY